jgi:hypothetical protein
MESSRPVKEVALKRKRGIKPNNPPLCLIYHEKHDVASMDWLKMRIYSTRLKDR